MNFIKQDISAKTLCIIDIGSYKLRICAASFKNKRVEILAYHEKRQESSYFANQECTNLPGLCRNISESIEKLERQLDIPLDDIVINYPFGEIFLASKTIHHQREHPKQEILEAELVHILEKSEKICLKQLAGMVDELYGIQNKDLQILLSRVNTLKLDGNLEEKVLHKTGTQMSLSLVNAFIPASKHNILMQISHVLGKNMYRILPTEFCIAKIFEESDIVIINVGATQTSITLKQQNEVQALSKISIGINDLVQKIARKNNLPRAEIIDALASSEFIAEKNEFLQIWGEALGITLQDMLKNTLCPKYFFVGGGGGNNAFIQQYLHNFSFARFGIHTSSHIENISEDLTPLLKIMKSIKLEDIQKMPLDIYVLLHETNTLISQEADILSLSLKQAIERLGYIKS